MQTTSFRQTLTVNLPAQKIYDMYMDSRQHTRWIGARVKMTKKPGGKFEVFDGYAYGKNLELKPGRKIVQTWIANEAEWPGKHESVVEFTFKSLGKNKTQITLNHKNVPAIIVDNFKSGWKDYYWTPLKQIAAGR